MPDAEQSVQKLMRMRYKGGFKRLQGKCPDPSYKILASRRIVRVASAFRINACPGKSKKVAFGPWERGGRKKVHRVRIRKGNWSKRPMLDGAIATYAALVSETSIVRTLERRGRTH